MRKRKYNQTKRAEQQAHTRARILEAAVALHESLGPANTSIKAIAENAGVQRLTVYRYFPNDHALFEACTSHWFNELHPPPKIEQWASLCEADQRSRACLLAFYRYYRQTEAMMKGGYRDLEKVEALREPMKQFEAYLENVKNDLLASWNVKGKQKQLLSLTLRHALQFPTWLSFKNDTLNDKQMVEIVLSWIQALLLLKR